MRSVAYCEGMRTSNESARSPSAGAARSAVISQPDCAARARNAARLRSCALASGAASEPTSKSVASPPAHWSRLDGAASTLRHERGRRSTIPCVHNSAVAVPPLLRLCSVARESAVGLHAPRVAAEAKNTSARRMRVNCRRYNSLSREIQRNPTPRSTLRREARSGDLDQTADSIDSRDIRAFAIAMPMLAFLRQTKTAACSMFFFPRMKASRDVHRGAARFRGPADDARCRPLRLRAGRLFAAEIAVPLILSRLRGAR